MARFLIVRPPPQHERDVVCDGRVPAGGVQGVLHVVPRRGGQDGGLGRRRAKAAHRAAAGGREGIRQGDHDEGTYNKKYLRGVLVFWQLFWKLDSFLSQSHLLDNSPTTVSGIFYNITNTFLSL